MFFFDFLFWLMFGGPPVNCRPTPDGQAQVCQIGETNTNTVRDMMRRRR